MEKKSDNSNNNDDDNVNVRIAVNKNNNNNSSEQKKEREKKFFTNYNQSEEPSCRQIPFYDGVAWEIVDINLIENLQYHFLKNYEIFLPSRDPKNPTANALEIQKRKRFPGVMPLALTSKNIDLLKSKSIIDSQCDINHKIFNLPDGRLKRQSTIEEFKKMQDSQNVGYVTRKSNGIRYILMFDYRDYERSRDCYQTLWDRSMKPLLVKFEVPDYIHQGTIIDGELVKEPDGKHIFYCFDLICLSGRSFLKRSLNDRLKALNEIVGHIRPCSRTNESPFTLKNKRFMPITQLIDFLKLEKLDYLITLTLSSLSSSSSSSSSSLQAKQSQSQSQSGSAQSNLTLSPQNQIEMLIKLLKYSGAHPCDGLIFILSNRLQLKWKILATVDFEIRFNLDSDENSWARANEEEEEEEKEKMKTCRIYIRCRPNSNNSNSRINHNYLNCRNNNYPTNYDAQLWKVQWTASTFDFKTLDTHDKLTLSGLNEYQQIQWLSKNFNGKIIECFYNPVTGNWQYILTRHDKKFPNFIDVVQDTINSIKDNIQIADLIRIINS